MPRERENNISENSGLGALTVRAYDIQGNKIRAFFDADDNLIFIIDDTVTPDKPNALLVIDSFDDRKWDDILSNDYNVSLEMVRPKKDNKYQKLDIEYNGLDEYDNLIRDYDDRVDLAESLGALEMFRHDAARRAATERLAAAEKAAENARETIAHANESIAEHQARLKELRTKLAQQKKAVGREPTKQSAAKILRTESQIDALKDKQNRAQRRLDNARRRLVAAEEDAEIARNILARFANDVNNTNTDDNAPVTVPVQNMPIVAAPNAPIAKMEIKEETIEPKAKEMAEEVKPLFDKDPEILDEEIAFKPIDFGAIPVAPTAPSAPNAPVADANLNNYSESVPVAPLSFTPPVESSPVQNYSDAPQQPAPVLDTITSVEMPAEPPVQPSPVVAEVPRPVQNEYVESMRPAPISPSVPGPENPTVAPVRPVSPVTGSATATPVGGNSDNHRPTLLYYVMLIALIVLSIFTLWLYQKKNNDTVPDLASTTTTPVAETAETPKEESDVFIQTVEEVAVAPVVVAEPEPAPVVVEPEPESEPEYDATVVDETVPAVPVVAEPEVVPIDEETPFISEPEPEPVKASIVVNKPVYNAGAQNENMFVADTEYDTDVVATNKSDTAEVQNVQLCDDGTLPYDDGCCGDEVYTKNDDGVYACCSPSSGECYAPLF